VNVVLIEPEIPNNTGNIGRLCLGTGSKLHLVKPLGFEINDSRLKRAGLDYWQHLDVQHYESVNSFFDINKNAQFAFFSSHAKQSYLDIQFMEDLFLVFGKESVGLSDEITNRYPSSLYKIPLFSEYIRSLNLANAVSIALYEGLRQIKSVS
jgi:tRNA (cytidine/uridine-2'-O-)-methyltransferase